MRELTKEELALAPEWAVKFDFLPGGLFFMSDVVGDYCGKPLYRFFDVENCDDGFGVEGEYDLCTRDVVRDEFDITSHKFSDGRLEHDGDTLNAECLVFSGHLDGYSTEYLYLELNKDDVIALAKHFKLTASDLK